MMSHIEMEYAKTLKQVSQLERELAEARAEIVRLTKRKDECGNGWDGALATVQRLERELSEARGQLHLCNVDQFTTAAELAEAKKDAERYRWLRETLQSAKGGAYVTVNEHLSYYEKPEIGKEVKIQWYPITPIGFYIVEESTLDAAIDAAMKEGGE